MKIMKKKELCLVCLKKMFLGRFVDKEEYTREEIAEIIVYIFSLLEHEDNCQGDLCYTNIQLSREPDLCVCCEKPVNKEDCLNGVCLQCHQWKGKEIF
jgi:hypothetical protein